MTLKDKQNHYNVKFLKGYGHSVSLKDNKIILKNGLNPFSDQQEQEEWFITNLPNVCQNWNRIAPKPIN